MDGQRPHPSLRTRADECKQELTDLRRRAQRAQQISPKKAILLTVLRAVEDNLQSLQAWLTEYSEGKLSDSEQTVESAGRLFEILYTSIVFARESLKSRLRYRRRYLIGFYPGKR